MTRPNLRSLPTLETLPQRGAAGVSPADQTAVAQAEAELAGLFSGLLARGRSDEDSPDYELLEAAVDGTLDPVEAELFASRLAGDPELQREFDELLALRDQLRQLPSAARHASRPSTVGRPASRRWLGFAAAALVLAAAGIGLRQDLRRPAAVTAAAATAPAATQSGHEVVFADSFEGGTTGHWSN